jgi:hypothetical protein
VGVAGPAARLRERMAPRILIHVSAGRGLLEYLGLAGQGIWVAELSLLKLSGNLPTASPGEALLRLDESSSRLHRRAAGTRNERHFVKAVIQWVPAPLSVKVRDALLAKARKVPILIPHPRSPYRLCVCGSLGDGDVVARSQ